MHSVEALAWPWGCCKETIGEWRTVASMLSGRAYFSAVILQDKILVAGGHLANAEIFTPPQLDDSISVGQWTSLTPMPLTMEVTYAVVFNEDVYVIGKPVLQLI